ncbi:MAG: glycosyltransferase family 2 protein [Planctomycetaceae bacterium]|nr:glycosyltransferase family 2 protein [Planctomycetaceae bacterium]
MSPRFLTALPVYNEESHVLPVLEEVRRHADDVLVVDDGSRDRTPLLLAETEGIEVLTHPVNRGYGAALASAFDYAIAHDYDALVTIDCDGQHQPRLIRPLVQSLYPADGQPVDIVSGSRYLETFANDSIPPADRRRINAEITRELNERLGLHLTDAFCGFKAYRCDALAKLEITEFGYGMPLQLWVQAARSGLRTVEFPVPLIYLEEERSFGGSLDDAVRRRAHYQEIIDRELAACGCQG